MSSFLNTKENSEEISGLIGCVKWFNNKTGYGFITITFSKLNPEFVGKEIFVHHTAIIVKNQQYKYLVQGEYVELSVAKFENSNHELQASDVKGVHGGKLMCETRYETKQNTLSVYKEEQWIRVGKKRNNPKPVIKSSNVNKN